jgi:hypothetical protein
MHVRGVTFRQNAVRWVGMGRQARGAQTGAPVKAEKKRSQEPASWER